MRRHGAPSKRVRRQCVLVRVFSARDVLATHPGQRNFPAPYRARPVGAQDGEGEERHGAVPKDGRGQQDAACNGAGGDSATTRAE